MTDHFPPLYINFLNRFDIEALALTDAEILGAIELGLKLRGEGKTVIEPRVHLEPGAGQTCFQVSTRRGHGVTLRLLGSVQP